MELVSGKVRWELPRDGNGTMVRCGDHLLNLHESGQLILIKMNPEKYEEVARAQITRRGTRTYPAIVGGLVYLKGPKNLVCLDLKAK